MKSKNFLLKKIIPIFLLSFIFCFSLDLRASSKSAEHIKQIRELLDKTLMAVTPPEKIKYSSEAIDIANECVKKFSKDSSCYYYRALSRGLYHKTASLSYKKGLKKVMADLEKVIKMNPGLDDGGAFRTLGNIYLKVPAFSSGKSPVVRDLDKALENAKKAMRYDRHKKENRLLMVEVLFELEKYDEVEPYLDSLIKDYKKTERTWEEKSNTETLEKIQKKVKKRLLKAQR